MLLEDLLADDVHVAVNSPIYALLAFDTVPNIYSLERVLKCICHHLKTWSRI